ncbi:GGDEF domain-containing phosphodiesterase [Jidongwangia harbinensis]|uniref:GGDEF domain-containing phosphodiesterase n=1 Tax=Jidongwangia harbinensis TaxID=2878561 RepID=UPI001CD9F508|nr:GGDEF domain-containing phosphodiesterase [Jidongwangia harbinensis]MCA2216986.1 EAL domain-containing protein [Jidongwangia harbinensis]
MPGVPLAVSVFVGVPLLIAVFVRFPATAGAGLVAACSVWFGVLMIRAAAAGRSRGPRLRAMALGGGVLLAGLSSGASGVAALVAPGVLVSEVPLPAEIPLVSLFLVAGAYLPAILRPHQRREPLARLRVGLDTVGVTSCLIFPPWLLLFGTGERRGAAITALILGGAVSATVAVAGVHAIRQRAALLWCGSGAALSLIGLTALVIAMDLPGEPNAAIAAVAAAAAINVAAAVLWHGSVRISPDARPLPPAGSEASAGFPLFALPVLGSALAAVYHLLHGGSLDAMSIVLGVVAMTAVAGREWTSAIALRRHADHLDAHGNRLRSLVFGATDVAMVLDADLAVRWQSPAAARQFGLSDQEVLGRSASALVHPDQADTVHAYLTARMAAAPPPGDSVVVRLRDGFGRWRETEWTTSGADPAEPGRTLVVHVRDVSNLRDLEQALHQAAHLDPQTGLANREGLRRAAELTGDAGVVIVIELGGLTAIGDVHGADLAEAVVVEAARRLRSRVDSTDVPARLGETRLGVLTRSGAVRAHLLAGQVLNALSAPYPVVGKVSHLSAWAGLADITRDAGIDEVIRRAALALRSVRSGPPASLDWYEQEMEARFVRRSTLEQDLPGAVARGELDLTYQPIVDLSARRPVGVEAVPAWRHPTLGPVPAGELLALAGDLGLRTRIGHWVLHRSCRLLADWRRRHGSLWLAVTVGPAELAAHAFQAGLHQALAAYGIPPSALVVQVAEEDLRDTRDAPPRSPAEDVGVRLGSLRAQGIRTAVSNFGAGPTSLSRLRILPIDLLIMDREVFGLPDAAFGHGGAVMDVAVGFGRRLGLEVIANGLRTPEDLDVVQAAGCRLGQGELLGRPMPAERFEALLEQHRDAPSGNN